MPAQTIHDGGIVIVDYRCDATPQDIPFVELHTRVSMSYVRRGSFGCKTLGCHRELVVGSFLVGYPGDEYKCTHEHHDGGDECLSVQLAPDVADELGAKPSMWRVAALPPIAELAVAAEFVQRAITWRDGIGVDEAGLALVARFVRMRRGLTYAPQHLSASVRRRMVQISEWLSANAAERIDLTAAAAQAGLSPFHFLRSFKAVLGVSPHQFLLRTRLRVAANRLLDEQNVPVTAIALEVGFEDLSNFVRTFHRAAGISPGAFRKLGRPDRNIFQESLHRHCEATSK
jgi:AraC family transcriptional regulator